jgi:hypothetical protein
MSKIPAPLDGKNVTTDWIEGIFDDQNCVEKKDCAVGFIQDQPVLVAWNGNSILWKFTELETIEGSIPLAVLKDRLKRFNDPERDLVDEFHIIRNILLQKIFWKDE